MKILFGIEWDSTRLSCESDAATWSASRDYPKSTLFVTYCAGPHCNSAARAAGRLARLGYPVKLMAGGVTGWMDEGFELERS
jgi:rhodanese-related sulfurtransferase